MIVENTHPRVARLSAFSPPPSLTAKRLTLHDVALNSLRPMGHEVLEGFGERSNEVVRIL